MTSPSIPPAEAKPATGQETTPAADTIADLRQRSSVAAKLELAAYGAGMVIKFASGLILSRLLFPEAFGLSVIVGTVTTGLTMLTNVGVGQAVVQHPRGDDPVFLNTGWTVLVARGAALWAVACILAYPLALVLREPRLATLIPVGAASVLIGGFASTNLITLRRHLRVAPLITLDLLGQVITLTLNVAFAWYFRSVWGLIAAGLLGGLFTTIASHFLPASHRNRFAWDSSAWSAIYTYGKWVQASSALSFASMQFDRFVMVRYVDAAALGVYNYALILSEVISAAVVRVTHGVLFPAFSHLNREQPQQLLDVYYRLRLKVDWMALIPIGAVAAFAQPIVDMLFDARYHAAGWMLQALCVRAAMTCTLSTMETYLFSIGQTRYSFYRDVARTAWVVVAIPAAWTMFGLPGLVWAAALSEVLPMIVIWWGFARLGLLRIHREVLGWVACLVGFGLGAVVRLGIGR